MNFLWKPFQSSSNNKSSDSTNPTNIINSNDNSTTVSTTVDASHQTQIVELNLPIQQKQSTQLQLNITRKPNSVAKLNELTNDNKNTTNPSINTNITLPSIASPRIKNSNTQLSQPPSLNSNLSQKIPLYYIN